MKTNRRSFILSAAFGTVAPSIVMAESLLDLPGDPLTARGLVAAQKYAEGHYAQNPGCRLVYSDGSTTKWMDYSCLSRPAVIDGKHHPTQRVYAVAMEVAAPQVDGKRYVTSVAIDNKMVHAIEERKADAGLHTLGSGKEVQPSRGKVHHMPGFTRVPA